MQAIGSLAGGIAHEFNNILTALLGYADLTLHELPPGGLAHEYLGHVTEAGRRARDLVDQILTFSRRAAPARRVVRLDRQVSEALSLVRATLPATIEIRERLSREGCLVLADPTQLQQVLLNLCANAEHAMRPGGGVLEVIVEPVELERADAEALPGVTPGPHVRLVVRDTGHGIPPEQVDRIWEPFFTTKVRGEGTGMGLSIVHSIVAAHEGVATVTSERGRGTAFTIHLPRHAGVAADVPKAEDAPPESGSGRVLFVDDEPAIARLGGVLLQRLGFEAVTRPDGASALEAFQEAPESFRLVITDQTMPGLTGSQLLERLRAIRADIPAILTTGFSHAVDEATAHDLGFDAFCMKPFDVREFRDVVFGALGTAARRADRPAG